MQNIISIISVMNSVDDPRIDRTKLHDLTDILVISVCAAMCGMMGWEEIQAFGEEREEWFKKFLDLKNGIPSHDTFRRVFERVDPKQLRTALTAWTESLQQNLEGKVVAIDGKTLKGSCDSTKELAPLHLISAWAAESNFVLGQCAVGDKENEITKIPELLRMLELKGAIVTIDAMGCQKEIAKIIVNDKKANYVFALKRNHPDLHSEVKSLFSLAEKHKQIETDCWESTEKGHGRIESRQCICISAGPWLEHVCEGWTGLNTVAKVVSIRQCGEKTSEDARYFISSLPVDAKEIARAVRLHWSIENTLHWSLDVVFKEDSIQIKKDNSPENLAVIRKMAVSLAKQRTPKGMTTKRAMLRALLSWDFANQHFLKD